MHRRSSCPVTQPLRRWAISRPRPARLRHKPSRPERSFTRLHLGMITACLAVAGCAATGDTAKPTDQLTSTNTPATTATPAPVPVAGINEKLLTPTELADIVGDTDMKPGQIEGPSVQTQGFDPPDCAALAGIGATFSYWAPGLAKMAGNVNFGARNQMAAQLISVWQDPSQPKIVVDQSAYEWGYCPLDKLFTVPAMGDVAPTHWVPSSYPPDSESRVGIAVQRRESPPRTCYHVMASQANLVVEAMACGDGDAAQQAGHANEIASRILAKFPQ